MRRPLGVALASLLFVGCASAELPTVPVATRSDAAWIQRLDSEMMEFDRQAVSDHQVYGEDSQLQLWEELTCMRRVQVEKARAVEDLIQHAGLSGEDALAFTELEPDWAIALEQCRK